MADAGIRKGFIILKANNVQMKSVEDMEQVLKAAAQISRTSVVYHRYVPVGQACKVMLLI